MEEKVLISLPLSNLQTLIIDCVNSCLKHHSTQKNNNPLPSSTDEFLTIKEACEMLNVSRGTLYRYESQGRINIYGIGARRLLKRSELLESLTLKK